MIYNPDIHKRKSIRLKNYDYSQKGLYFITISCKDKLCIFGNIKNGKLNLYDSGKMVQEEWVNLENRFSNIKLHNYIVMPNHFHGIIEVIDCRGEPCVHPNAENNVNAENNHEFNNIINCKTKNENFEINRMNRDKFMNSAINRVNTRFTPTGGKFYFDKNSIKSIIQAFKSITTTKYIKNVNDNNWNPFNKKLWQVNYYEHIIRDEDSYVKIVDYVENNYLKWNEDKFYYENFEL